MSSQPIFTVTGRVRAERDTPLEMLLSLVDRDRLSDDLVGYGIAKSTGHFRLSFTREAFNQEWYENEDSPDLELIVSELVDGELKVLASAVLPSPTVEHPTIDVGTVTVAEGRAPDGPPMPGYLKQARRMRLDQGLAERAAAEIAPMIEQLTGWPSLLTGVTIEVVDDIHLSHRRIEAALELPVASGLQGAIAGSQGIIACYDPFSRVISLDRGRMEHQNYDRSKVLIGYELVHVGQFREHPMLLAEYRAGFLALLEQQQQRDLVPGLLRDLSAAVLSGAAAPLQAETIQQQLTQRQAALADIEQPFQMLNKNIEGYAFHVEVDFVRAVYNCAWPMPHHSAADHLLSSVVGGLQSALSRLQGGRSSTDGSDTSTEQTLQDFLIEQMGADLPQYIEGRAFYQQHQQHPQRPARFYPYAHHPPAGEAGHSG